MNEQASPTAAEQDHQLVQERRAKLEKLRAAGKAFPNRFKPTDKAAALQAELGGFEKEALEAKHREASVAGRIMAKRGPFMVLQDGSGRIQLYLDKKHAAADEIKTWDLGDIVYARGPVHKSGKGDLYVFIDDAHMLTKALRPLPDKYHGLADQELRYRQRYLDLIMSEETREVFITRTRIIQALRQFLLARDFLEVETPMMQVIPGGATARPFVTYHHALDLEMYLRIAPELYLKRLVVGGFERVFEINRNFRNEGLSTRHNPEFTMIEFYQAYADYKDLMDLTETLLAEVAQQALGTRVIQCSVLNDAGDVTQVLEIDLGQPFKRFTVLESIAHHCPHIDIAELAELESARTVASAQGIAVQDSWGLGKIQIEIFEALVEEQLIEPTFITAYPAEVSPLARRNDEDPFVTDRFEFFVAGRELANGFSELNDAEDQAARFQQQVAEKEAGDSEAMHYDADYITALEYGLPPTAGEGIGIDRLVMLLTNKTTIRDVILFPHLRPKT